MTMDELDDRQKELLFKVIQNGKIRKLTSFFNEMENIDIDFEDSSGKTPLMCAVCYDEGDDIRTHMVRTLLRHGCDTNKQDAYGCTALMYSCMDCDCEDVTRLLTKKGNSDPNIQDNDLNTALTHAVNASNATALYILVTSSATRDKINLNLKNSNGLTPLELAIKLKRSECCKVLVRDGCADIKQTKDLKGLRILLGTEVDSMGKEHSFLQKEISSLSTPTSAKTQRCKTPVLNLYRQTSRSSFTSDTALYSSRSSFTSDAPLQSSRNSFSSDTPLSSRSNYSSSSNQMQRKYDISWAGSPRKIRRALTPLLRDNARIIEEDDQNLFGHRMRLPSIPSGKKLCMVNTSQADDF